MSHAHNKPTANKQIGGVDVTKGADPNNVYQLEVEFVRDIQRRFREVRGVVRQTIGYENDAFNLSQNAEPVDVFDFPTDAGKRRAFRQQLAQWVEEAILEVVSPLRVQQGDHWTAEYIENAYVRGIKTAQGRLMQEGVSLTADSRDEILEQAVNVRALEQLYTRTYENLENITETMADSVREELTRGFAEGWNPKKMADSITNEIRDIERTRAVTVARTETINAATDAQINEYQKMGVEGVQHVGRMTAKDESVCPFCRAIDDVTFTMAEFTTGAVTWGAQTMRLGIPSHPNGRCTVMPTVDVGELEPLEERLPNTIRGKPVLIIRG